MNKKKIFISSLLIFIISFFIHNLYVWFPNNLTFIISPINESIWEHMKMIFTSYMLFSIIKMFIVKTNYLKEVILSIINIIIFLIIYLPIYYTFGENLIITLILYFISIIFTRTIGLFIIKKDYKYQNIISLILIIIIYIIFTYLSYNPLNIDLFIDPTK